MVSDFTRKKDFAAGNGASPPPPPPAPTPFAYGPVVVSNQQRLAKRRK